MKKKSKPKLKEKQKKQESATKKGRASENSKDFRRYVVRHLKTKTKQQREREREKGQGEEGVFVN